MRLNKIESVFSITRSTGTRRGSPRAWWAVRVACEAAVAAVSGAVYYLPKPCARPAVPDAGDWVLGQPATTAF